jgi:hypothetical protein
VFDNHAVGVDDVLHRFSRVKLFVCLGSVLERHDFDVDHFGKVGVAMEDQIKQTAVVALRSTIRTKEEKRELGYV